MKRDEYIKELRKLYELAVKTESLNVALEILNIIKEIE